MPRIAARRAVGLAPSAALALLALAGIDERVSLLLAALTAAALLGCVAGRAVEVAGSAAHPHDEQLRDVQRHLAQRLAARRSAAVTAPPAGPELTPIGEPLPGPGPGSPIGAGHLATLARPPADEHPAG